MMVTLWTVVVLAVVIYMQSLLQQNESILRHALTTRSYAPADQGVSIGTPATSI